MIFSGEARGTANPSPFAVYVLIGRLKEDADAKRGRVYYTLHGHKPRSGPGEGGYTQKKSA